MTHMSLSSRTLWSSGNITWHCREPMRCCNFTHTTLESGCYIRSLLVYTFNLICWLLKSLSGITKRVFLVRFPHSIRVPTQNFIYLTYCRDTRNSPWLLCLPNSPLMEIWEYTFWALREHRTPQTMDYAGFKTIYTFTSGPSIDPCGTPHIVFI